MYSQTSLIGNLCFEPEPQQIKGDQIMVKLTVATHEKWKDKITNEEKTATEFHRVKIWPVKLAQSIIKYWNKGDMVMIVGENKTQEWVDKDGHKRKDTSVDVNARGTARILRQKRDAETTEDIPF